MNYRESNMQQANGARTHEHNHASLNTKGNQGPGREMDAVDMSASHSGMAVGEGFQPLNRTQAQIGVSHMLKVRESEAAKRALEMSQKVQSNTMGHVREQIAKIQQQVQMQKDLARTKVEANDHHAQMVSIAQY